MIGFDPQAHNDRDCMACPKHIKKTSHLGRFYLWLALPNTNLLKPSAHCTIFVAGNRDLVFCRQRWKRMPSIFDKKRSSSATNLLYVFPAHSKFSSPATKISVLSQKNCAVCARLKWLAESLVQVLNLYSSHCVKDSFTFANLIQNCNLEPAKSFLCSFDISSLFTNVPLDEIIEICANALYRGPLDCPPFPEDTFRELMLIATQGVEFSFNNQMYKQLDGVAMGSPLGPALANIFVGFYESRLFDNTAKPGVYSRYVDDSFAIFGS